MSSIIKLSMETGQACVAQYRNDSSLLKTSLESLKIKGMETWGKYEYLKIKHLKL